MTDNQMPQDGLMKVLRGKFNNALTNLPKSGPGAPLVQLQEFFDNSAYSGPGEIHGYYDRLMPRYRTYPFNAKIASIRFHSASAYPMKFQGCDILEYEDDGHGIPVDSLDQSMSFDTDNAEEVPREFGLHGTGSKNSMVYFGPLSIVLTASFDNEENRVRHAVAIFGPATALPNGYIRHEILLLEDLQSFLRSTRPKNIENYISYLEEQHIPGETINRWIRCQFLFDESSSASGAYSTIFIPFEFLLSKALQIGHITVNQSSSKREEKRRKLDPQVSLPDETTGISVLMFLWKDKQHMKEHLARNRCFDPCKFTENQGKLKYGFHGSPQMYDLAEEIVQRSRYMSTKVERSLRDEIVVINHDAPREDQSFVNKTYTYQEFYERHAARANWQDAPILRLAVQGREVNIEDGSAGGLDLVHEKITVFQAHCPPTAREINSQVKLFQFICFRGRGLIQLSQKHGYRNKCYTIGNSSDVESNLKNFCAVSFYRRIRLVVRVVLTEELKDLKALWKEILAHFNDDGTYKAIYNRRTTNDTVLSRPCVGLYDGTTSRIFQELPDREKLKKQYDTLRHNCSLLYRGFVDVTKNNFCALDFDEEGFLKYVFDLPNLYRPTAGDRREVLLMKDGEGKIIQKLRLLELFGTFQFHAILSENEDGDMGIHGIIDPKIDFDNTKREEYCKLALIYNANKVWKDVFKNADNYSATMITKKGTYFESVKSNCPICSILPNHDDLMGASRCAWNCQTCGHDERCCTYKCGLCGVVGQHHETKCRCRICGDVGKHPADGCTYECQVCGEVGKHHTDQCTYECQVCSEVGKHQTDQCTYECNICGDVGKHHTDQCTYECQVCSEVGKHQTDQCTYECQVCSEVGKHLADGCTYECQVCGEVGKHHTDQCTYECQVCSEVGKHQTDQCTYECNICGDVGKHHTDQCTYECQVCSEVGKHQTDQCTYECQVCSEVGKHLADGCTYECQVCGEVGKHHTDQCTYECQVCSEVGKHQTDQCTYECNICGDVGKHHTDQCTYECQVCSEVGKHQTDQCTYECQVCSEVGKHLADGCTYECQVCGEVGKHHTDQCTYECQVCSEVGKHQTDQCTYECNICGDVGKHHTDQCTYECQVCSEVGKHQTDQCTYECQVCSEVGKHLADGCTYECQVCGEVGKHQTDQCKYECQVCGEVGKHHADQCKYECPVCKEVGGHNKDHCEKTCDKCGFLEAAHDESFNSFLEKLLRKNSMEIGKPHKKPSGALFDCLKHLGIGNVLGNPPRFLSAQVIDGRDGDDTTEMENFIGIISDILEFRCSIEIFSSDCGYQNNCFRRTMQSKVSTRNSNNSKVIAFLIVHDWDNKSWYDLKPRNHEEFFCHTVKHSSNKIELVQSNTDADWKGLLDGGELSRKLVEGLSRRGEQSIRTPGNIELTRFEPRTSSVSLLLSPVSADNQELSEAEKVSRLEKNLNRIKNELVLLQQTIELPRNLVTFLSNLSLYDVIPEQ